MTLLRTLSRRFDDFLICCHRSQLIRLVFLQQWLDDGGKIALHDVRQLVQRKVYAVIGYPSLREIVSPDSF